MENCKKRNIEHCAKSKQCDQLGALKSVKFKNISCIIYNKSVIL